MWFLLLEWVSTPIMRHWVSPRHIVTYPVNSWGTHRRPWSSSSLGGGSLSVMLQLGSVYLGVGMYDIIKSSVIESPQMEVTNGSVVWGAPQIAPQLTNSWWTGSTALGMGFSLNNIWLLGILLSTLSVPLFEFFIVLFFLSHLLNTFLHIAGFGCRWSFSQISLFP